MGHESYLKIIDSLKSNKLSQSTLRCLTTPHIWSSRSSLEDVSTGGIWSALHPPQGQRPHLSSRPRMDLGRLRPDTAPRPPASALPSSTTSRIARKGRSLQETASVAWPGRSGSDRSSGWGWRKNLLPGTVQAVCGRYGWCRTRPGDLRRLLCNNRWRTNKKVNYIRMCIHTPLSPQAYWSKCFWSPTCAFMSLHIFVFFCFMVKYETCRWFSSVYGSYRYR